MSAYTGQVQVDFTHDPTSASFTWVDLTNRARAASYKRGRNYELAQVEAAEGTLKMRNDDGALDPTNGASTYSPNVLPFRRIQHNVTVTGPGTVPIFTGLVERWPQEWDNGYGSAPVQVVDIFSWLNLAQLRSVVQQEVLADSPYLYLPLTDDANTTTPEAVVAPAGARVNIYTSKYGAGTVAFGSGNGPDGPALLLTQPVDPNSGSIPGVDSFSLPIYSGGTVTATAIRVNWAGTAGGINILAQLADVGLVHQLNLQITTGGFLQAVVSSHATGGVVTGPNVSDGKLHDLMAVMTPAGGATYTMSLYVDGALIGTSSAVAFTDDFVATQFAVGGGTLLTGAVYLTASGTYSHAAVYTGAAVPNASRQYNAGANGFAGETADTRIARLLRYAGWTATTALGACVTTMLGATDLAGKSALAAIQEVQTSEGGVFFVSNAGVLTYKSRRTRMQTTASSVTFGENTAGGEIPYVDIALDFDPTYVYNDVQITRTGNGHATSAASTASQLHYGKRTYSATFGTQSDTEAQDAANWQLNTSLAPHARVRSITIDAIATAGAWAALLPLEIGSRVTVKRRPNNAAPAITINSFVESIAWDIVDGRRARCTLELSPIPVQALIADDATYGICDSTFVAAW